jgi:glycosyltransferase involved in cell wall biosynthesis
MFDIQLVSIVIPTNNDANSISLLTKEIMEVMSLTIYKYEIIFINYGKDKCSWETICQLTDNFSAVRGIHIEGNHNQTSALQSCFSFVKGDVIVLMNGNMVHDPAYIPVFLAYVERGYEVVCGLRKPQQSEGLLSSLITNMTQKLIFTIAGTNVKYFGATYKAYRRYLLEDDKQPRKETRMMDVPIKFRERKVIFAY